MAHTTEDYDLAGFRFRNDDGDEVSATWMAGQNVAIELPWDGTDKILRLRYVINEAGGTDHSAGLDWGFGGTLNGGASDTLSTQPWADYAASAFVAHQELTTDQLSGGGGTFSGSEIDAGGSAWPQMFLGANGTTQLEGCFVLYGSQLSAGDVIQIIPAGPGWAPTTQTQVAQITLVPTPSASARHGIVFGHKAEGEFDVPVFQLYPSTEFDRNVGTDSAPGVGAINDWSPEGTPDDTQFLCNPEGADGFYDAYFYGSAAVPPPDLERSAYMVRARVRMRFRGTPPTDDGLQLNVQLITPELPSDDPTRWIATDDVFFDWSELSTEWQDYEVELPLNNTNIPYFTRYRLENQIGLTLEWLYTTSGSTDAPCFIDVSAVEVSFFYEPGAPATALETLAGLSTGALTDRATTRWALDPAEAQILASRDAIDDRQLTWTTGMAKRATVSLDELPLDRNGEFLCRFQRVDSTEGDTFRFLLYGSGAAGSETGLFVELDTTEDTTGDGPGIELRRYSGGGLTNRATALKDVHAAGRWYFMRVRVIDDIVRVKVWNTPVEPQDWDLVHDLLEIESINDGTYGGIWQAPEWGVGVGSFATGTYLLDWVAADVGPSPGSIDLHAIVDQTEVNPFVGPSPQPPANVVGHWAGNTEDQVTAYANVHDLAGGMANVIDVDTNVRRAYVWEALRHSYNGEIYTRFMIATTMGGDMVRLIARGDGVAGAEEGVFGEMRVNASELAVRAYTPDGFTAISSTPWSYADSFVWQRMRFRVEGELLKVKHWLDEDPEPATWDLETSRTDLLEPGWFGFGFFTLGSYAFDFISITTSQEAAPPTAPEPTGPYENYYSLFSYVVLGGKTEATVATTAASVEVRHGLTLGTRAQGGVTATQATVRHGLTLGHAVAATSDSLPSQDLAVEARHGLVLGGDVQASVQVAGVVRHGLTLGAASDGVLALEAGARHGLVLGVTAQAEVVLRAEAASALTLGHQVAATPSPPAGAVVRHGLVLGQAIALVQEVTTEARGGLTLGARASVIARVDVSGRAGVALGATSEATLAQATALRTGLTLGSRAQAQSLLAAQGRHGLVLGARSEAASSIQTDVRHGLLLGHAVDTQRRLSVEARHGLTFGGSAEATVTATGDVAHGLTLGASVTASVGDAVEADVAHGLALGASAESTLTASVATTTGLTLGARGSVTATSVTSLQGGLTLGTTTTVALGAEALAASSLRLGAMLAAEVWTRGTVTHGLALGSSGAVRLGIDATARHGVAFGHRVQIGSEATLGAAVTHGLVLGHRLRSGRALRRAVELLISAHGFELDVDGTELGLLVGADEMAVLVAAGDAPLTSQGTEQEVRRSGGEIADVLVGADEIPMRVSGAGIGMVLATSSYEVQVEVESMAMAVSADERTLRSEMQEAI